jgi:hypothetical protein
MCTIGAHAMTAQMPERLIDEGVPATLACCPPLPRDQGFVVPDDGPLRRAYASTACWREYQATWVITEGVLWLADIRGAWRMTSQAPIRADWITGALHVWHGQLLHYAHMGFASICERHELIGIRKGVVVGRSLVDHRRDQDPDALPHELRLRLAMPAGLIHFVQEPATRPVELTQFDLDGIPVDWIPESYRQGRRDLPMDLVWSADGHGDGAACAVQLGAHRMGVVPGPCLGILRHVVTAGRFMRPRLLRVRGTDTSAGARLSMRLAIDLCGVTLPECPG